MSKTTEKGSPLNTQTAYDMGWNEQGELAAAEQRFVAQHGDIYTDHFADGWFDRFHNNGYSPPAKAETFTEWRGVAV